MRACDITVGYAAQQAMLNSGQHPLPEDSVQLAFLLILAAAVPNRTLPRFLFAGLRYYAGRPAVEQKSLLAGIPPIQFDNAF